MRSGNDSMNDRKTIAAPEANGASRLYARLWRWHFFAAFIVIPFVLWQGVTGTLYLWSERLMDAMHPELRFVEQGAQPAPPSEQIGAALRATQPPVHDSTANASSGDSAAAHHAHHTAVASSSAPSVVEILIPDDARRSTTVLLRSENGLSYPVFVDPHTARVLGTLATAAWLPGLTRALHGGWPLGDPGSWLLEIGAGWAMVMLLTGLYLWWPRDRSFLAGLWPRVNRGWRVLIRDLHSCVAVWFSIVLAFFLVSAMPWTAFWGGQILDRIQHATGQVSPAGFSPGGASVAQVTNALTSVDTLVDTARRRGVPGILDVRLAPWPDAPLFITNVHAAPSQDRTIVGDAANGALRGDYRAGDLPAIPRFVALGVHVHQGDFGLPNLWLNTAFAAALIWLGVTGVISWWTRRPSRRLGAPPKIAARPPRVVLVVAAVLCVMFPLLGVSVLAVLAADFACARLFVR
jgi:uncharacterized iron-regulated membrane protein